MNDDIIFEIDHFVFQLQEDFEVEAIVDAMAEYVDIYDELCG